MNWGKIAALSPERLINDLPVDSIRGRNLAGVCDRPLAGSIMPFVGPREDLPDREVLISGVIEPRCFASRRRSVQPPGKPRRP